jgi:hypothetical protein
MVTTRVESTSSGGDLVDRFLASYNRIDRHLRAVLNGREQDSFTQLVQKYFANRSPRWRESLLVYAQIRNFLTHGTTSPREYLVVLEAPLGK